MSMTTALTAAQSDIQRNQDASLYVGNLDDKVTEGLLWELFIQAGPVVSVFIPKDRITDKHQGFGFVEFMGEEDADYAARIMNMIKLYGKPIRVNKASTNTKNIDIGANLFIGNLDPEVDEKLLYDTFSAFGVILSTPKIMRDPESGGSKGFAFVNFASFEASDAAIEAMNGQYLCNRPITISYAFKKDSKGERHGTAAERLLAAQNPLTMISQPHTMFADAPPTAPTMPPGPPPGAYPMPTQTPGLTAGPPGIGMPPAIGVPPPGFPAVAPPTPRPPPPPMPPHMTGTMPPMPPPPPSAATPGPPLTRPPPPPTSAGPSMTPGPPPTSMTPGMPMQMPPHMPPPPGFPRAPPPPPSMTPSSGGPPMAGMHMPPSTVSPRPGGWPMPPRHMFGMQAGATGYGMPPGPPPPPPSHIPPPPPGAGHMRVGAPPPPPAMVGMQSSRPPPPPVPRSLPQ